MLTWLFRHANEYKQQTHVSREVRTRNSILVRNVCCESGGRETIIFVRNKVHWHFYFRVFMQQEFSHSSVSPEVGVHCVGKCNLLFWWVRWRYWSSYAREVAGLKVRNCSKEINFLLTPLSNSFWIGLFQWKMRGCRHRPKVPCSGL